MFVTVPGTKAIPLTEWLKTDYCMQHGINTQTVAEPVKVYLGRISVC
jgi:hypothetical protein